MKHKKLQPAKSDKVGPMLFNSVRASAVFLLLGLGGLNAQDATTATGGEASGTGGTASYSIGQLFYTTNTGTNGSVAQGVQQAYEISTIVGIDVKNINIELSVYPNPTTDYLTLKVEDPELSSRWPSGLNFQLYDMQGKLLENKKIVESSSLIKMEDLPSSTYFLKVYSVGRNNRTGVTGNQTTVKTFRIIKN